MLRDIGPMPLKDRPGFRIDLNLSDARHARTVEDEVHATDTAES
jgi:hypothetical protein